MKGTVKFLMILWASISVFGAVVSLYMFFAGNNSDGIYFGIVSIAGIAMFYINRRRYHTYFSNQDPPKQKN